MKAAGPEPGFLTLICTPRGQYPSASVTPGPGAPEIVQTPSPVPLACPVSLPCPAFPSGTPARGQLAPHSCPSCCSPTWPQDGEKSKLCLPGLFPRPPGAAPASPIHTPHLFSGHRMSSSTKKRHQSELAGRG